MENDHSHAFCSSTVAVKIPTSKVHSAQQHLVLDEISKAKFHEPRQPAMFCVVHRVDSFTGIKEKKKLIRTQNIIS